MMNENKRELQIPITKKQHSRVLIQILFKQLTPKLADIYSEKRKGQKSKVGVLQD